MPRLVPYLSIAFGQQKSATLEGITKAKEERAPAKTDLSC